MSIIIYFNSKTKKLKKKKKNYYSYNHVNFHMILITKIDNICKNKTNIGNTIFYKKKFIILKYIHMLFMFILLSKKIFN